MSCFMMMKAADGLCLKSCRRHCFTDNEIDDAAAVTNFMRQKNTGQSSSRQQFKLE